MQFFVSILNNVKPDSGWDTDTTHQQGSQDDLDKNQNKEIDNINK